MADEKEEIAERSRPLWARCRKCAHCWPVAYLPIDMATFSRIAHGGFTCPKCGDRKPFVAKQDNGTLLEEEAA